MLFANPMGFDRTQLVTLGIAIFASAYLVTYTINRTNKTSAQPSRTSGPSGSVAPLAEPSVLVKFEQSSGATSYAAGRDMIIGGDTREISDLGKMVKTLVQKVGDQQSEEQIREARLKKYPLGWAIFGLDGKGGVYPYETKFRVNVDVDLRGIKLAKLTATEIAIEFPGIVGREGEAMGATVFPNSDGRKVRSELTFGHKGTQGALIHGPRAIGALGGTIIGDLVITVEILAIEQHALVFLVGFEKSLIQQGIRDQRATEFAVGRYHEAFNQTNIVLMWDLIDTEVRKQTSQDKVREIVTRRFAESGKVFSTSRVEERSTPDETGTTVEIAQKTIFEKGQFIEIFRFRVSASGTNLVGYKRELPKASQ